MHHRNRPRTDKLYFIELQVLNPNERQRLLNQLLTIYKVELNKENFYSIANLLFGLPDQVMYAVDLIRDESSSSLNEKLPRNVSMTLRH